jgi:hypothetical protein
VRRCLAIALLPLLSLGPSGCERGKPHDNPQLKAEFGVFFGGQIQERKDIPFELDGTKQSHGFRVTFAEAPAEAHEVAWQLSPPRFDKPTKTKKQQQREAPPVQQAPLQEYGPSALPSAQKPALEAMTGSGLLQPGQRELSRVWTFKPGDPLGVWNIRITVDRRVLIDRPFLVYDAHARAELNRGTDAGR